MHPMQTRTLSVDQLEGGSKRTAEKSSNSATVSPLSEHIELYSAAVGFRGKPFGEVGLADLPAKLSLDRTGTRKSLLTGPPAKSERHSAGGTKANRHRRKRP